MAQTGGGGAVIDYDTIVTGLGYIPADASAVHTLTASDVSTALNYIPANDASVLKTAADISACLGYVPSDGNMTGFIKNITP